MRDGLGIHLGVDMLRRLGALAKARRARGDSRLFINPISQPQEFMEFPHLAGEPAGLVLEPYEGGPFEIREVSPRSGKVHIGAFCDGTRSTYFVGFEDIYPLLYAENGAAIRWRDPETGFHASFSGIERRHHTLLAPFGLLDDAVRLPYERLGLCPTRHADLCRVGHDDEYGVTPDDMQRLGSLAWQGRGQRRARFLMELGEQIAALAAARVLRQHDISGNTWLLKDGSLFQVAREYLRDGRDGGDALRQIVSAVKTHPVPFFGVAGERALSLMRIGERSVAFLPRPGEDPGGRDAGHRPSSLQESPRPMVCWYLRVRDPGSRPDCLSGVIRLDMAATPDWRDWIDEVSWAVLDEFYGLSALPDPRSDVMCYGIHECEQLLHARMLPSKLLLAALAG